MVGLDIPHENADIDELQSMDLRQIVEHKALAAYEVFKKPVIVEDTSLRLHAMGQLPGPYIKWFLEELGIEGLAKLSRTFDPSNREATVGAMIAYYDGTVMNVFSSDLRGMIADAPRGDNGFGWNQVFIPNGQSKTLGEMDDTKFTNYYRQIKPFDQLRQFLDSLQA